jgi:hypothetical protein
MPREIKFCRVIPFMQYPLQIFKGCSTSFGLAGIMLFACLPVALYPQDSYSASRPQPSSTIEPPSNEVKEAQIYRLLFRQSLTYKRLADEADAAGAPKPHFRRILANRLQLSEADAASLLRLSLAYQAELDPIQNKIDALKAAFLAKYSLGVKAPWQDARPPEELGDLLNQGNAIALRYRDLLQNDLTPNGFQNLVTRVHVTFGQTLR